MVAIIVTLVIYVGFLAAAYPLSFIDNNDTNR
jgi:hypothetical protein